jgi:branched-chain amino acid transport system ATP-binding protein
MLLAEQNARMALGLASYGYVLADGVIVKAADTISLAGDSAVREAYLGV